MLMNHFLNLLRLQVNMEKDRVEKMVALHNKLFYFIMKDDIESINDLYNHIDSYNLDELITLLRTSSIYKPEIKLWSYAIVKAYDMCKDEGSLPRKELWGMI